MKSIENYIFKVKSSFKNAVDLKQNCKIYISTKTGHSFSFYFKKGDLVWASNSNHRFRRLYRITNRICPEVSCQEVKLREQEISELWEYLLINVLYKRNLISIIEVKEVIQAIIKEVLFDCFIAQEQIEQVKVIFETKGNQMGAILKSSLFKQPIVHINYKKTLERVESIASSWNSTKLKAYSPSFAPVIKDIDKLKKAVESNIYQQIFIYIDGKKTIRDLADIASLDLITIANNLLPQIENKAIALQQVPDLELKNLYFSPASSANKAKYQSGNREYIQELDLPLVVCVDDDPNVCQNIAEILNPIGYRLLPVNDAAKALVVLLENQASLIFLDTQMPDANGYELCSQIKKMPALKEIPIIILREKETMVDRFRSKIVGAADAIDKPISHSEVLTLTQKHTQNFTVISSF